MDLPLPDIIQREMLKVLVATLAMPAVAILGIYIRSYARSQAGKPKPKPTFRRKLGMVMAGLVGFAWLVGGGMLAMKVRGTANMFWQLEPEQVDELRFYTWDMPQSMDEAIAAEPIATLSDNAQIARGFSLAEGALQYKRRVEPPEILERGLIVEIDLAAAPEDPVQSLYLRIVDRTSRDAGPKAIVEPFTSATMRTSLGLYEDDDLVQWAKNIAPRPPASDDELPEADDETADIAPADQPDENRDGTSTE